MPTPGGPVVVVGSINMDLVCRTREIPRPGETILGNDFVTIPGGKGANQAVAAAKLARNSNSGKAGTSAPAVYMVGRVGEDDFGERLLNGLVQHKVDTRFVTVTEGVSSGVAMIIVNRAGENSIVVAPGANARLTPRDVDAAEDVIATASAVVMQLEIPHETVRHTIAMCQRLKVCTILDPAPAEAKLPRVMMGVDVLTPNQLEAEMLLGLEQSVLTKTRRKVIDPKQIGMDLLARGPKSVVLKLGKKGAMLVGRDGDIELVRGFDVDVTDTTAAGDAFTAALAVAHQEQMDWPAALRFANAAGALACQNFGAQPSLPGRDAVEKLMKAKV
jgi:ribokinase